MRTRAGWLLLGECGMKESYGSKYTLLLAFRISHPKQKDELELDTLSYMVLTADRGCQRICGDLIFTAVCRD
jgi:hypothetical protein